MANYREFLKTTECTIKHVRPGRRNSQHVVEREEKRYAMFYPPKIFFAAAKRCQPREEESALRSRRNRVTCNSMVPTDGSLGIVGYRPSGEPVGCVSLEKH